MNYKYVTYIFIPLFVFLTYTSASSQGVGLSGKRYSIFYNLDIGHSFKLLAELDELVAEESTRRGLYYNELEDEKRSTFKSLVNLRQTLQIDYNLRRNFSLGLSGSYFRRGFGVVEPALYSKNYTSFSYGINLKFFSLKKGGIAPLGPYINARLFNTHNFLHHKGNSKVFGDNFVVEKSIESFVGFSLAWGKQGILKGNVLYNLALELGYVFGEELRYVDFLDGDRDDFAGSLMTNYIFKFTFGIGICPF